MNLLIHDLDREKWESKKDTYAGWNVVTDNGTMHPCVGCFSCWNRTPGICAIKDGYENMGSLIHEAEEVAVISRYTYGGFSGSVKNVFDRCLGYVLPQFEVIKGETHHKKRYDEDKPFTFIFYGPDLTADEKESARRYVEAVCANIRGYVKELEFITYGKAACDSVNADHEAAGSDRKESSVQNENQPISGRSARTVLLNGSMRNVNGNSARFARILAEKLSGDPEIIDLKLYMSDMEKLVSDLADAETIVLCVPLYVDGLPSQVIRLMETFEASAPAPKKIYVLANMGLYESSQLRNLFSMVRQWCGKMHFEYCGGLGISAGELLGTLAEGIPFRMGPTKKASEGMDRLANAVNHKKNTADIYAEPHRFPRLLYIAIANTNWNRTAKQNGIRPKDLYRRL